MTDELFIHGFLEKNFNTLKANGFGFTLIDEITGKSTGIDEFKHYFIKIIGDWKTDDNKTSFDICLEWLNEKKNDCTKELDKYLSDCQIELGGRDWVVKKNNEIIDINTVREFFSNIFQKEFVTYYYGEWFSEKVCNAFEDKIKEW